MGKPDTTPASGKVRLIAIDLDGTLLDSHDRVSEVNRLAVRKAAEAGAVPVIASGRNRVEADFVLDALPEIRYFIGINGGMVEDVKTGAVLQDCPLDRQTAHALIEWLDAAGLFIQIYGRDGVFCTGGWTHRLAESGMSEHYLAMFADRIGEWTQHRRESDAVYKLIAVAPTPEKAAKLMETVACIDNIKVLSSLPALGYFEILPTEIDKAQALALLCSRLNISREFVLAIGDSENDRDMLAYAGMSAVVGNAAPALHELAGYIAVPNDQDGVADAIGYYLHI